MTDAPERIWSLAVNGCGCPPPNYCGDVTCVDYPVPDEVWNPRYRRKPPPKAPDELAQIRSRAWATRRAKYGEKGYR